MHDHMTGCASHERVDQVLLEALLRCLGHAAGCACHTDAEQA